MTHDLAGFLLARIAEDETLAQGAPVGSGRTWFAPVEWGEVSAPTREQTLHIVAWDPARVLAECDAKRRIVEDVFPDVVAMTNAYVDATDESPGIWPWAADRLLMLLALPYADHPDYRQEWKP